MKKTLLLLGTCLALVSLGGCKKEDPRKSRSKQFSFSYFRSGYGTEWVKQVADYYMDNVNTDVFIDLKQSVSSISARTEIEAGASGMKDLYQLEVDMSNHQQYLKDLTEDIYNFDLSVYGETGLVKDKIEQRWIDFYNEDNHWYRLPQTVTNGWNWCYNKTTLDAKLGKGNWRLPNTTDQFIKLGDDLYNAGAYLFAYAGGGDISGEYTRYANDVWFAQMTGLQGYEDYYGGFTRDTSNKRVFCQDEPTQILDNANNIYATYDIVRKLFTKANGYVHPNSDMYSFTNINQVLYNGKVNGSSLKAPAAFAYVGSWLETEIQESVEYGFINPDSQEVLAMKMPVNSAIINRTPTINDDNTLSEVISYIDGVPGAEKPTSVSDEDVEVIREARSFVAELICREFVVPKNGKNSEEVLKFLAWLTTDVAQKIASKATKGVNVLPYGYVPTDEDMGFEISPFLKSVASIKSSSYVLDESGLTMPYKNWFGVTWCRNANTISNIAFGGKMKDRSELDPVTNGEGSGIYDFISSKYQSSDGMSAFLLKYPNYGK